MQVTTLFTERVLVSIGERADNAPRMRWQATRRTPCPRRPGSREARTGVPGGTLAVVCAEFVEVEHELKASTAGEVSFRPSISRSSMALTALLLVTCLTPSNRS